jgi:predicted AAA+ superfamily ATPase
VLWEHLVLNELHAALGRPAVRYWRTKSGREVDFVIDEPGRAPDLVECKWTLEGFEPDGMKAFRARYPGGRNLVVAGDARSPFTKRFGTLTVRVLPIGEVAASYERPAPRAPGRRSRRRST